tara:strand:- start:3241 stop:3423 length:183 start_codon:yes stop_codon:yes gene_type:complete
MDPRQAAQQEAEKTFEQFILWSKRSLYIIIVGLVVVVVGCNNGVDGSGSGYNGEQYDPKI